MMASFKTRQESWGAIRKLPSGRYQASYAGPDGERHKAPSTFDAKEDARVWLAEQRVAIQRGTWQSATARAEAAAAAEKIARAEQFRTYSTTWLAQRVNSRGEPLRPTTRQEYARQLRIGLATFATDRLSDITPARVREWHAERMQAGASAAGAEARLLRAIFNTAVHDGILAKNPVPTNLTRSSTGIQHRPPTLGELGVLLDTIGPRFRLALLLAAYGGLRLSEWRALRRRDLTFENGRVFVTVERQALYLAKEGWHVGPPKSAEGSRVVALPSPLTVDVEQHLAEQVAPFPDSLLFAPVGRSEFLHDAQFTGAWNRARDAAGVRTRVTTDAPDAPPKYVSVVREHDLRAFAATTFAQSGATLRETMRFLGHSTTEAAMAYQHAAEERMHEITDRMPMPDSTHHNIAPLSSKTKEAR